MFSTSNFFGAFSTVITSSWKTSNELCLFSSGLSYTVSDVQYRCVKSKSDTFPLHSRLQRPRSFQSAPDIDTSGRLARQLDKDNIGQRWKGVYAYLGGVTTRE